MANLKPELDAAAAEAFLRKRWGKGIEDLRAPEYQGELSRVYFFRRHGKEYVIRFNGIGGGFSKERYVTNALGDRCLPVPRILEEGESEGLFYAVSERAAGGQLGQLTADRIEGVVPDLFELMHRFHRLDTAGTIGWGWIRTSGDGTHGSLGKAAEAFFAEEQTGFWQDWHGLFDAGILERGVYDELYARMMDSLRYSPCERYWVHGDFHLGNLLSDGRRVTAIVDWEMALYGDFMLDLGTLHLWHPQFDIPQRYLAFCRERGTDIPHFDERLQGGLLFKGLDALRFFAKTGNPRAYEQIRDRLLQL